MSDLSYLEHLYPEERYVIQPKTLVILEKAWTDVTPAEKTLLTKILGSIKLSLAAVQIITLRGFELADLAAYAPKHIITFGSYLKGSATHYEVLHIDETAILQADALALLDDAKKKSLWSGLKQMFGL